MPCDFASNYVMWLHLNDQACSVQVYGFSCM